MQIITPLPCFYSKKIYNNWQFNIFLPASTSYIFFANQKSQILSITLRNGFHAFPKEFLLILIDNLQSVSSVSKKSESQINIRTEFVSSSFFQGRQTRPISFNSLIRVSSFIRAIITRARVHWNSELDIGLVHGWYFYFYYRSRSIPTPSEINRRSNPSWTFCHNVSALSLGEFIKYLWRTSCKQFTLSRENKKLWNFLITILNSHFQRCRYFSQQFHVNIWFLRNKKSRYVTRVPRYFTQDMHTLLWFITTTWVQPRNRRSKSGQLTPQLTSYHISRSSLQLDPTRRSLLAH